MKTCPKCQQTVNDEYLFCPKCGTNLKNCPHCGKMLPEDANFCPYCGKSTKVETAPAKNSAVPMQQDNAISQVSKPHEQEHADSVFSLTASKDFFENNFISNDGITQIRCKEVKEDNDGNGYSLLFSLDGSIQVESFISMCHAFETETVCLAECFCSGFADEGHPSYFLAKTIEDMSRIRDKFENPYIQFIAKFCHKATRKYCFSLSAYVNSDSLQYCIDSNLLDKEYLLSPGVHDYKRNAYHPDNWKISKEAHDDIVKRFSQMYAQVFYRKNEPNWTTSETSISLSDSLDEWGGHDETITTSIRLTFSKEWTRIENIPWETESEWPCSGQALIFSKPWSEDSAIGLYSYGTHKAWLLKEPYGMPGLWRFEYYSSSSRS